MPNPTPRNEPVRNPVLSPEQAAILRQASIPEPLFPTAADQLAAMLAKHTTYGHVYQEMMIGPDMAAAMLQRNRGNRKIRRAKAAAIGKAMVDGRWELTPESIKFDFDGILRDGQHRLMAVVLSGATVPMTIVFGCDPSEAEFYDQGIPRSVGDIAREHGHTSVANGQALVAMILRLELQDTGTLDRPLQTRRLDDLYENDPHFEPAIRASIRAKGIVPPTAAALAHWTIAHNSTRNDRLEQFWNMFTSGAGLPERSPVLRLREFFRDKRNLQPRNGRDQSVKVSAAIIIAWNSWVDRRVPRNFKWDFAIKLPEVS